MRVWVLFCIVLGLITAPVSARFLIIEVCPDGYAKGDADEYFLLSGSGSLDGWVVIDGKGSIRFLQGSASSGVVTVAREGVAYCGIPGSYPDYEVYNTLPPVPDAIFTGRFQMVNTKDDLTLLFSDHPVQSISWPDDFSSKARPPHLHATGICMQSI